MICELCGKETDRPYTVYIEGSKLKVCKDCSRFGDQRNEASKEEGSKIVIEERLERRERRMKSRDVFAPAPKELADDYPARIKEARRAKDWDQDALAKRLNEKKSVITKLEAGTMVPSDKLRRKIERLLDISLMESPAVAATGSKGSGGRGLTLGDMIKVEKKK